MLGTAPEKWEEAFVLKKSSPSVKVMRRMTESH